MKKRKRSTSDRLDKEGGTKKDSSELRTKGEVKQGFSGAIGNTPLLRINGLSEATGCDILAKAEFMNPGGSVKDRAARFIIDDAEKEGKIKRGGWIVEATAGNTGIGLAHIANERGYKCLFTIPDKMTREKIEVLETLGAKVEIVPTVPLSDPRNFFNVAKKRAEEIGGFFTNQFDNLSNYRGHYATTGPEIWRQTSGKVDAIATTAGTGGTIGGISRFLKEKNSKIVCYLIENEGSGVTADNAGESAPLILREKKESEKDKSKGIMEGIGSSIVYQNLKQAHLDGIIKGSDKDGVRMAHYLLRNEGIFVGGSSALNVVGAVQLAKKLGPGHTIVTILPDSGIKYLSKIYNKKWLEENNFDLVGLDDATTLLSTLPTLNQ